MNIRVTLSALVLVSSVASASAIPRRSPKWMLESFIGMTESNPDRLLQLGETLFSEDRLRQGSIDPQLAFEWQHRLALVSAISGFFDPALKGPDFLKAEHKKMARALIEKALFKDPSLLVRDGAVESIRRIFRMNANERKSWQPLLENAFFDNKNHIEGEGLFIRETILTALREGSLKPSRKLTVAVHSDRNPQVRDLLKAWKTEAYDDLR